jgi:hypothetical protein
MTPLHSTLKRALSIDGRDYVVTLTPAGLKLTLKGKRNGIELAWAQLINGEAALAVALHASLGAFASKEKAPPAAAATSAAAPPAAAPPAAAPPAAAPSRAAPSRAAPRAAAKPKRKARAARKK